uniref:Tudor domain-containing protein n=1 Tax=Timema shepardi TaxID=629360 RepID=A0A7R9G387_TIMSH|nr:unnamed protein product [Timema shepardi]
MSVDMSEDDVLFVRGEDFSPDDWDDSKLVHAYDKTMKDVKKKLMQDMGIRSLESQDTKTDKPNKKTKPKKQTKQSKKWVVGGQCRCIYSADGEWYEASILKIFPEKGTCLLRYAGYKTEEEVSLDSLLPSAGPKARKVQEAKAVLEGEETNGYDVDYSDEGATSRDFKNSKYRLPKNSLNSSIPPLFNPSSGLPPFVGSLASPSMPSFMPPVPMCLSQSVSEDSEAVSAMLMSWYMSGYHTGYYQGLKDARSNQSSGATQRVQPFITKEYVFVTGYEIRFTFDECVTFQTSVFGRFEIPQCGFTVINMSVRTSYSNRRKDTFQFITQTRHKIFYPRVVTRADYIPQACRHYFLWKNLDQLLDHLRQIHYSKHSFCRVYTLSTQGETPSRYMTTARRIHMHDHVLPPLPSGRYRLVIGRVQAAFSLDHKAVQDKNRDFFVVRIFDIFRHSFFKMLCQMPAPYRHLLPHAGSYLVVDHNCDCRTKCPTVHDNIRAVEYII